MKKILSVIIVLFIALAACQKKVNVPQYTYPDFSLPADVPGDSFRLDSLPFRIGNSWTYKVVEQLVLVRDSSSHPSSFQTAVSYDSFLCTVTVVGDTFVVVDTSRPAIRFIKMHSSIAADAVKSIVSFLPPDALTSMFGGPTGDYYYALTDVGVYNAKQFSDPDRYNWGEGSTLYDHAILELRLPAIVGERWSVLDDVPIIPRKIWVGYARVSTPSGVFNCIKLSGKVTFSTNNYFNNYFLNTQQYYSQKGLVQQLQVKTNYNEVKDPYNGPTNRISRKMTLVSTNF